MNVLIGFEESQIMTAAFLKLGHNVFSNDIKPTSGNFPMLHINADFFNVITLRRWDLVIIHPPCTCTCLSGNRWYYNSILRKQAVEFTAGAWTAAKQNSDYAILEQPKTMIGNFIGRPSQIIQPYQYGHREQKETTTPAFMATAKII